MTKDEGEEGPHVKLEYTVPARTLFAGIHVLRPGALVGAKSVRFRVKSTGVVTLVVAMEEKRNKDDKTNYSAMINVDGLAPWKEVTIPISDFHVDEGQTDPDGKLNLDKVDSLFLADISGMGAAGDIKNTLWIADLVAVK